MYFICDREIARNMTNLKFIRLEFPIFFELPSP
jgi:hypothetical protein